jgi:hypothetical protein
MPLYSPDSTLIEQIITALANIARNQISGISYVYEQPPDGPPDDMSVLIPLNSYKILDDTNGKLYISMIFGIRLMIRRGVFSENIMTAYSYVRPFLQAYAAWGNQTLGGLSTSVCPKSGGVTQMIEAGQPFAALITNVEVLTEYNIPTS